jgi:flavorubredoxin
MRAVVIYESLTGNTAKAAQFIGSGLVEQGVVTTVCPTTDVDFQAVADADLVIVGTWTDGLFFFAQKPARSGRLSQLPLLTGKRCAVFCTFALDPGKTLDKLTALMTERGANVLGGMTIRRNNLEAGSREFVDRVLGVVAS